MDLDPDAAYRALSGRDARFDGAFFAAVRSTGIYCRPSCPARTPLRRNVCFYPSSAAAQRAGYRACKRCRPDATPGSAAWNYRADLAARAARLIADGVIDRHGVSGLAQRLGYSERQVGRTLLAELGAPALSLARAQRAQTARVLLENSTMPASDIAFAAGFGSIRQFNDTMQAIFASTPGRLRTARTGSRTPNGTITLRLAYRQPMDLTRTLQFLAGRMIAGVEAYDGLGFRRTLRLPMGHGLVDVRAGANDGFVEAQLKLADYRDLPAAVARIRRWLDLDADPIAVDQVLAEHPATAPMAAARPGLRAVGAVDGFEMAIRAVAGQQISVKAAMRLLATLVAQYGEIAFAGTEGEWRVFPRPEVLASIDPATLPMPRARGRTIVAIAAAVSSGTLDLAAGADREATRQALLALPGVGPWTAGYVLLRALSDPDVYLDCDLVIRRQAALAPALNSARAAPWRSYLTHHLWAQFLNTQPVRAAQPVSRAQPADKPSNTRRLQEKP